MKTEHKIVVISVMLGLLFWVVDALVDGHFFLDKSFWEVLVLDVPPYEIYIRSLGMGFFLVSGLFVSRSLAKRRRAEEALQRSEKELRLLSSQLLTIQENERGRIARELHDELGTSLASIKIRLETLIKQATSETDTLSVELLQDLVSVVQKSVEEVRNVSMALRPSTLDALGIISTITWFCREFQKVYPDIRIETEIDIQEDEVAEPLKIIIYRIIQEALQNVGKHSKADTIRICLQKTDGMIELAVEDNGSGFDTDEAFSVEASMRGFGLGSMKERTELSDGTFVIDSVKAKGTIIRASWPTQ